MMEKVFGKLFWGFLLIMFDFRLQGIDLLPDVIGYILMAGGLKLVLEESASFAAARKLVLPLGILSLGNLYEPPAEPGVFMNLGPFGAFGIFLGIVYILLNIKMVFHLFQGIIEVAKKQANTDLAQEAHERWKQYLALQIAVLSAMLLFMLPGLGMLIFILVWIASIVVMIGILNTMKRCGRELHILRE